MVRKKKYFRKKKEKKGVQKVLTKQRNHKSMLNKSQEVYLKTLKKKQ